jgi:hypothetical protein
MTLLQDTENNADLTSGGHGILMYKNAFTVRCPSQKSALQSMHPAQSLGFLKFPGKRGVQNRTFTTSPRTFTKILNIIANTPGKLMAPGRSFWKSTF